MKNKFCTQTIKNPDGTIEYYEFLSNGTIKHQKTNNGAVIKTSAQKEFSNGLVFRVSSWEKQEVTSYSFFYKNNSIMYSKLSKHNPIKRVNSMTKFNAMLLLWAIGYDEGFARATDSCSYQKNSKIAKKMIKEITKDSLNPVTKIAQLYNKYISRSK